jgi:hypothetical protein
MSKIGGEESRTDRDRYAVNAALGAERNLPRRMIRGKKLSKAVGTEKILDKRTMRRSDPLLN